jgi:hypothetical protein
MVISRRKCFILTRISLNSSISSFRTYRTPYIKPISRGHYTRMARGPVTVEERVFAN